MGRAQNQTISVAAPRRAPSAVPFSKDWRDSENVRAAVGSVCQGRDAFPAQGDFKDAGLVGLYLLLRDEGSLESWAKEMGLPYEGESTTSHWTDEEVRRALMPLCQGRKIFPTQEEFEAAGLTGLHTYLSKRGLLHEWAEEMGCHRSGPSARWTDKRIEAELVKLCNGRDKFPRGEDFRLAGLYPMYQTMMTTGRLSEWQEKIGLKARRNSFQ